MNYHYRFEEADAEKTEAFKKEKEQQAEKKRKAYEADRKENLPKPPLQQN